MKTLKIELTFTNGKKPNTLTTLFNATAIFNGVRVKMTQSNGSDMLELQDVYKRINQLISGPMAGCKFEGIKRITTITT